jgi:hypothetical protein
MVEFMKMSDISEVCDVQLQIMLFIHNALERGWSVKKVNGCYIFNKKHENKKEYFSDAYLKKFIKENITTP